MAAEIDAIAKRRYIELSKQRAAMGVSTPPEIMMEIADLYQRYGPIEYLDQPVRLSARPPDKKDLDLAFIIAQLASLTHRQLHSEQRDRLFARNLYLTWGVLAVMFLAALAVYGIR